MSANALSPAGYAAVQITLHWLIGILLVVNAFFTGEGMGEAWDSYSKNNDATGFAGLVPQLHVWIGLAILAFAVWRLFVRMNRGVPQAPAEESAVMRMAAHATHILLYTLMLLIPLSGIAVFYFGIDIAGEIHGILRLPLIALVLLHVLGAVYQRFWLKSVVLNRMMKPEA